MGEPAGQIKAAFSKAEQAYHKANNELDNNRTLLIDYKERLIETDKAKKDAWKAYTEGIIKCGFRGEPDYHGAQRPKQRLGNLRNQSTSIQARSGPWSRI